MSSLYMKVIGSRPRSQGQNKIENPYSRSLKHRSAITLVLQQSHKVCVQHGVFGYDESNDVIAIFVT